MASKAASDPISTTGVKLAPLIRNQSTETPQILPRKPSSRRLCKSDPPRPSSPVTTQPFSHITFHPPSDAEIPIPDTSPRRTRALWQLVTPHKGGPPPSGLATTVLPQRSGVARRDASQTAGVETASDSQDIQDIQDDAATTVTKDTIVSKPNAVEKWRLRVLAPRGIELVEAPHYQLAFHHFDYFGTNEDQCRSWILQRVESEEDVNTVFLPGGLDFNTDTAVQYTEMASRNLCEEEFASFAKCRLFRTPGFYPIKAKVKAWKAQRKIQTYTQPVAGTNSLCGPRHHCSVERHIQAKILI